MAYSGIGGQAVMEGVMMRNRDEYAVAVRKPNQEIVVEKRAYKGICPGKALRDMVFVRGIFSLAESLVIGIRSLMFSASFFEEEEPEPADGKREKAEMGFTLCLSVILALCIFIVLPYLISLLFRRFVSSETLLILIEGMLRIGIFIGYLALISKMEDIRRVFMYHGAEHKCINCVEQGMELTVENVKKCSKEHKRCGTSFLFLVIMVTIVATMFIRVDSGIARLLLRLAIIPVVAGISYEFIRLAGRTDNAILSLLSKPGLWLQGLTTKEPDEGMIEVGIASVEAVFDWRGFLAETGSPAGRG